MKRLAIIAVLLCGCHSAPKPSTVASDINQAVTRGMAQPDGSEEEWVIQSPHWAANGGAEMVCEGAAGRVDHCALEHGMTLEMVAQSLVDAEAVRTKELKDLQDFVRSHKP